MKTLARFFAAAAVISLAIAFTGPGGEFMWGFLKPLSALLFGAFFISNLLAKEYARYDEEHEHRMELARKQKSEPATDDDASPTQANVSPPPTTTERKLAEGERSAERQEREAGSLRDR